MYGMEYPDTEVFVNSTVPEWIYEQKLENFRKKKFIFSSLFLKSSKCDILHELVVRKRHATTRFYLEFSLVD